MNVKDLISVTLILFSVIDILGSLPIIINLKQQGLKIEAAKASLVSLVLMIAFLFLGESLLGLFGVDVQSFAVAGAIILFVLGLEMILGIKMFHHDVDSQSGTIIPIAFPLIAGAGSMTTILSLKAKYLAVNILGGIVLNILFVFLVLRSSGWISKKIGKNGTNILKKVFGIILLAIAIKLFKDNFHLIIDC